MPRNNDIVDEKDLSEDLVPVKSAPIVPGTGPGLPSIGAPPPLVAQPPQLGNYYEGTLPSDMQRDGFFVRTGYQSPQAASYALMPVASPPSQNAATQSVAQVVVDEAISKIVFPASGLKWRGVWSIANVYSVNDLVQFNSSTYIALVTNSQVRPDTDTTKWTLVSENFAFDATVFTPGVAGFGLLDQITGTNGTGTPVDSGSVIPTNPSGWALWATSAAGMTTVSGFLDFGIIVGSGQKALWLKSLTDGSAVDASGFTTGRWAANLALFDGAGLSLTESITSVQIASNVATITCASSFIVGTRVICSGLSGASFLNAQTLIVLSNTGTAFTATFVHANYGPTGDSGTATNYPFLQAVNLGNPFDPPSSGTFSAAFANPVTQGSVIVIAMMTSDVNASATISTASDSRGNSYTINNSHSVGGLPANRPWNGVAVANNVAAGSTTVSAGLTNIVAASGAFNLWAIELPGGGSSASHLYLPYDVEQFRGSFFVCNTETTLDAFDDPGSWNIIAQGVGSTVPVGANYQVLLEDWGRLIYNNTASNWTVTLPATVPPDGWMVSFQALNTGTITINPNGKSINGSGSNLTVVQNQGVMLYSDGSSYWTFRGFGTVFSVALSMPSIFSVAGSPITGSGTFTVTLVNQNANLVFAGPASGAAAVPTFRALVPADITPWTVATKTTTYSLVAQDYILGDTTGGGFTVTLPAASANNGKMIGVKKISSDGNTLTIGRTGSDTIDGATTQTITVQYNSMTFISDGTNWYII